jgi:hypothetical protein
MRRPMSYRQRFADQTSHRMYPSAHRILPLVSTWASMQNKYCEHAEHEYLRTIDELVQMGR